MLNKTHPQNPKSFTKVPTTEKVDFKVVVKDYDGILLPILVVILWVSVEGAMGAWPPFQQHHHLWNKEQETYEYM